MVPIQVVLPRRPVRAGAIVLSVVVALLAAFGLGSLVAAASDARSTALEGVLVIRHADDVARDRSMTHTYLLQGDTGETALDFQGSPPDDAMAGQRVRVEGVHRGQRFLVAAGGTKQAGGSSKPAGGTTGTRTVAVVLLNFSNSPTQPYTREHAAGVAFTNPDSVAAYYAETSWGKLTLTGQVFGWYTIPETDDTCATSAWSTSATAAAAAVGVDLGRYDHVVYAFPFVSACAWTGLSTMPGRSAWLNGTSAMGLWVMAHELGHNLGTHHASALSCTEAGVRVSLSPTCAVSEYGDPFSVMGSGSNRQHTNVSRANFDWLTSANTQTVSTSGTATLRPIESNDPIGVQLVRIPRGSTGTYLTLEYRQPTESSFDAFSTSDPVVNGVTIRISADLTVRARSQLVDATPGTLTMVDAPLPVGASLVDPVGGVTITTLAVSATGATVLIAFGPGPAPTSQPTPTSDPTPTGAPSPTPTTSPTPGPDTQPPTAPRDLQAWLDRGKRIELRWTASSDNVAVAGYQVFRDGRAIATTFEPRYLDSAPGRDEPHRYTIVAYDEAGNTSPPSDGITVMR